MRRYQFHSPKNYLIFPVITTNFIELRFCSAWRKIFSYNSYPTPAKGDIIKIPKRASQLTRVNLYADHIRYHAAWRPNLFFLLCIAYYQKKHVIQSSRARIQHGEGFHELHACHSSILPGLMDFNGRKCIVKSNSAIIDRSFLFHWNNMTVLCPGIVNMTDYYFEGFYGATSNYRKRLLAILCLVSHGRYDPAEGLQLFYMIMKLAIKDTSHKIKNSKNRIPKAAILRILQLQNQGTFQHANPRTCEPHKDFIEKIIAKRKHQSWISAYRKTQQKLLTGGEDQAIAFLTRFN